MAKTSYQLITPELSAAYSRTLTSGDRFDIPRVRRRVLYTSRRRVKGITEKSLLPETALAWSLLSIAERDAWNAAGVATGMSGYKCFLKEHALRLRNDLDGYGVPNLLHQNLVGLLRVESPATRMRIAQLHPAWYYVLRKVRGSRDSYESVRVQESFGLPLTISVSYNAILTAAGANPRARFYCVVESHYQGRTVENVVEVPFSLGAGWQRATATLTGVVGSERSYTAFIEIIDAVGDLLIDNVELLHSGQNWARDPHCNDMNQGFTKAFYQVAKHWIADDVPDGAYFESVYYT